MRSNFKGYDWVELARYFNIETMSDIIDPDKECKPLRDFLSSKIDFDRVDKDTLKICKEFLKKLIKSANNHSYDGPLWEGLLKIKHDETFMQFFIILLPCMWT